jgi:hypothetical protein
MERAQAMQREDMPTNSVVFGIQIIGSNDFPVQVARSLLLLKLVDPETFARVTNAIGIVRQDFRTAVWHTNKPPPVIMSTKSAFVSLTWCAAALAHEARHVELARQRPPEVTIAYGGHKPKIRGYKDFQRDELECIALELRVLKRLGATHTEVAIVKSQDGTHFDVNRDGKWDSEDERLQESQKR